MDAIGALFEAFIQLIMFALQIGAMIVGGAVYGLIHGYSAVTLPSPDPTLRRLQRWTLVFLVPGASLVIVAIVVMATFPDALIGLCTFVAGTVLLVVAGLIGERASRIDRSLTQNAD